MEQAEDPLTIRLGSHGRLEFSKNHEAGDEKILRLVVLYCSRGIELAHPRHLLQDLSSTFGFELPNIQFSWCLRPNLRAFFYKTSPIFRDASFSADELAYRCHTSKCACSLLPAKYRDHASGHLHTQDTNWIAEHLGLTHIATLLNQGLNHVPLAPVIFNDIMELNCWTVETVITSFVNPPITVEEAVSFATNWTLCRMPAILACASSNEVIDTGSEVFMEEVASVLKFAFVSGMDKAANHPFFICRDYALLLSTQNLQSASSFSIVQANPMPTTEQQIKDLLQGFLPPVLFQESYVCPIMFPLFKPRKLNYRYITSTCGSVYQIAGQICHFFALALLSLLKKLCGVQNQLAWSMHRIKIQMFGIIEDYRDCVINMPASRTYSADQTADISKCFDSIPTDPNHPDSLQVALKFCISAAFFFYSECNRGKKPRFWLRMRKGVLTEGLLSHRKLAGCVEVPVEVISSLQSFLIGNMFVQVGPLFARQTLGIPQGIPCGPTWANIYLFSFEYKYFKQMLRDPIRRSNLIAYPFDLWFRYIDDVKVLNNCKALEMMRDMYPSCLVLEPTSSCGQATLPCNSTFLDITCSISAEGQISFHTIFKTQTLPFQPIQYIRLRSNRPVSMCLNTLKGLSYSAASKASSPAFLFEDLKHIIKQFKRNGFPHGKTVRTILDFLNTSYVPAAAVDLQQFVSSYSHRFLRRT
jgi:hypothetical protein